MKPRHAEWAKLTAGGSKPAPGSTTRVLDLPGVRDLEGILLMYRVTKDFQNPRVQYEIDRVSQRLFGITEADVMFEVPSQYWDYSEDAPERQRINADYQKYEDGFETGDHLTDDEALVVLQRLGFDFKDDRGNPLICTKPLARQIEAAKKGTKGKLPDRGSVEAERFEDAIQKAADEFMASKRRG